MGTKSQPFDTGYISYESSLMMKSYLHIIRIPWLLLETETSIKSNHIVSTFQRQFVTFQFHSQRFENLNYSENNKLQDTKLSKISCNQRIIYKNINKLQPVNYIMINSNL